MDEYVEGAIKSAVEKVTPEIKDMAKGAMGSCLAWLKEKADATPNDMDNWLVNHLAGVLGVEIPGDAPAE